MAMAANGISVVDGDGHVMEDWDALLEYMPEPYIKFRDEFLWTIFIPVFNCPAPRSGVMAG
jgi:hypothetical protein